MARGNQRDKAREKNLKDKAGEVRDDEHLQVGAI
jgi:4F5 protein related disordered region